MRRDPAEVIAAAFDQAGARDWQHCRTWVALVYAAVHQLGLIRAEAARRSVTVHVAIGLVHVSELYLWKAAWSLHADPAAEDWGAVKALALLETAPGAAEITAEADAVGLAAGQRNGADTSCATWPASRSSCATTRPWPRAGPSRPG